ncbi:hypothetical protein GC209_03610 [bacterium]|nr:hypothetical protein [bacterium]
MTFDWLHFAKDETGAVTVDWVVLTAALVGIGLLVLIPIAFGTDNAASLVGSKIGAVGLGY